MSQNTTRSIKPSRSDFIGNISTQVKLIIRLMGDRRVNFLLKLLPLSTLAYLIFPDIFIGPLDDALVIWLGTVLFVELCPQEIVQEHLQQLNRVIPGNLQDPPAQDVIDGDFTITENDSPWEGNT